MGERGKPHREFETFSEPKPDSERRFSGPRQEIIGDVSFERNIAYGSKQITTEKHAGDVLRALETLIGKYKNAQSPKHIRHLQEALKRRAEVTQIRENLSSPPASKDTPVENKKTTLTRKPEFKEPAADLESNKGLLDQIEADQDRKENYEGLGEKDAVDPVRALRPDQVDRSATSTRKQEVREEASEAEIDIFSRQADQINIDIGKARNVKEINQASDSVRLLEGDVMRVVANAVRTAQVEELITKMRQVSERLKAERDLLFDPEKRDEKEKIAKGLKDIKKYLTQAKTDVAYADRLDNVRKGLVASVEIIDSLRNTALSAEQRAMLGALYQEGLLLDANYRQARRRVQDRIDDRKPKSEPKAEPSVEPKAPDADPNPEGLLPFELEIVNQELARWIEKRADIVMQYNSGVTRDEALASAKAIQRTQREAIIQAIRE